MTDDAIKLMNEAAALSHRDGGVRVHQECPFSPDLFSPDRYHAFTKQFLELLENGRFRLTRWYD